MPQYPIETLKVDGFGPFANLSITTSPSLNIVVGENATGKSLLLKLLYATSRTPEPRSDADQDCSRVIGCLKAERGVPAGTTGTTGKSGTRQRKSIDFRRLRWTR